MGKVIVRGIEVDEDVLELLRLIRATGSVNKAALKLGIPYSTAVRRIKVLEARLGLKLVLSTRGGVNGGGSMLTREALEIIGAGGVGVLRLASSHDDLLQLALSRLRQVEVNWVGSVNGLSMVLTGLADAAGVHMSLVYGSNVEFLKAHGALDSVVLIRGYRRIIGLGYRPSLGKLTLKDLVNGVKSGKYRFVKRNPGSGTRAFTEYWLKSLGITKVNAIRRISWTHEETARLIYEGEADLGILTQYQAFKWGLEFIPLAEEDFDIVARGDSLKKVEPLIKVLTDLRDSGEVPPGYVVGKDLGLTSA